MVIKIDATANVDSVLVDETVSATGTIQLDVDGTGGQFPLHIVFCIDTSGSMKAPLPTGATGGSTGTIRKIEVAKSGLSEASSQLSGDDTFAVVSFSSGATTTVSPTSGNRASRVESDVASLRPDGGTNITAGLERSRELLQQMPDERAIEWIVLISDGKGSAPLGNRLDSEYAEEGITIQSAGVGTDYDEDTLRELAHRTQGEQRHVGSADQLRSFFEEQVADADEVVALDPSLTLAPSNGTTIEEVYYTLGEQQSSLDPDWRGDTCHIDMADVNREKPPTVKMDMAITPDTPDLSATVLRATLETESGSVEDEITVEVGTAHTLEKVDEPAKDEEFILRKITDEAMNEGVEAARNEYRRHREDLSADAKREVESTLRKMEDDEKSGTDEFSTLPSNIED